jgi:hypothetical protein
MRARAEEIKRSRLKKLLGRFLHQAGLRKPVTSLEEIYKLQVVDEICGDYLFPDSYCERKYVIL